MDSAWLLRSSTLWSALALSGLATTLILLFSPDGLPGLGRRRAELGEYKRVLREKQVQNLSLAQEVQRLATKDPELMEALARRQGLARPGETIYTFRDTGEER